MSNQCSNNKHSNRMDSNYTSPYQSAQTSPSSSLATSDSYQSGKSEMQKINFFKN